MNLLSSYRPVQQYFIYLSSLVESVWSTVLHLRGLPYLNKLTRTVVMNLNFPCYLPSKPSQVLSLKLIHNGKL